MHMLFEDFFNNLLDFSDRIYQKLLNQELNPATNGNLHTIIPDTINKKAVNYNVFFVRDSSVEAALDSNEYASMSPLTASRRHVTQKDNKRTRRVVYGRNAQLVINVPEMIASFKRSNKDLYNHAVKFMQYIDESNCIRFTKKLSNDGFRQIVLNLINTLAFKRIFTHELQHHYGPVSRGAAFPDSNSAKHAEHRAPNVDQNFYKYVVDQDEIDSYTVEAPMYVASHTHFIKMNNRRDFVNQCALSIHDNKWKYLPIDIRKRLIRRWTKIFDFLRSKYEVSENEKALQQYLNSGVLSSAARP